MEYSGAKQIEQAAIVYLSRREYSRLELTQRLLMKGFTHAEIDNCLNVLADKGYQSDARFTEHFIRYKANAYYGIFWIKQALKQRGIAQALADDVLSESSIDWFETALRAKQKRYGLGVEVDTKRAARQLRYLRTRGFSQEQATYAMSFSEDLDTA